MADKNGEPKLLTPAEVKALIKPPIEGGGATLIFSGGQTVTCSNPKVTVKRGD